MVSWGGRHLESENIGRIDVPRSIRARRLEKERSRPRRIQAFRKVSEGSVRQGCPQPKTRGRSLHNARKRLTSVRDVRQRARKRSVSAG
jgi:hypothetical protein